MPGRNDGSSRPPEEWKSGGEPMTEAQASFLKRLSEDAGEPFDPNLSKADASKRIDELRKPSGGSARPARRARKSGPAPEPRQTEEGTGMTAAQAAYLKELVDEEGGEFTHGLPKEDAARRLGELLIQHVARASPTEPSRR